MSSIEEYEKLVETKTKLEKLKSRPFIINFVAPAVSVSMNGAFSEKVLSLALEDVNMKMKETLKKNGIAMTLKEKMLEVIKIVKKKQNVRIVVPYMEFTLEKASLCLLIGDVVPDTPDFLRSLSNAPF
jgi:hypothetical protein